MNHPLLEVIVQSVRDAREAASGGADRLEVVRAIGDGGLTPALSLVRAIAAETSLPLRVMVRENRGYGTDAGELPALRRAVAECAAGGVNGIVLGFACNGEPGLDALVRVLEAAPDVNVTFHRAFDQLTDPLRAIDELVRVPQIDRILTSGGEGTAAVRCDRLRQYALRAGQRVGIIAGGGVDEQLLTLITRGGVVREVHVGRAAREGGNRDGVVSAACVRRLKSLISRGP